MKYLTVEKELKGKSKKEIIHDYIDLLKEKDKLEKELRKYKNSNTPPSANKHIKANSQGLRAKKGARHGAPKNHRGATFEWPASDVIIPVTTSQCRACCSLNVEPTGYVKTKKVICPIKAKTIVKEYRQHEIRCLDCFSLTLATNNDIPEKGIYDKSIQSLVNYYKFKARLPHNIVVDVMNNIHNVPMTSPTSLEITRRASDKLEPLYKELEEDIKQADVVNGDETSHSVMGINYWIWVFCNALMSLFKFKKERGGDIVEKTLGPDFDGGVVSDGWSTYTVYSEKKGVKHQRCWDHLKREVKFECKEKHPDLYRWCLDIYGMVKAGKNYKQEKRRHDMFEKCKAELAMLITHVKAHRNLRKLATKIENGGDNWFTCILHPELPMDNCEAERSLRPFVLIRKIIGCLRSEIGMRNYEVMMSLISTWHKQGKNAFYMLENTL